MENILVFVLIPIILLLLNILFELIANSVGFVFQDKKYKYWKNDDEIGIILTKNKYSVKDIVEIIRESIRNKNDIHLLDIVQLTSFESFASISLDIWLTSFSTFIAAILILPQVNISQYDTYYIIFEIVSLLISLLLIIGILQLIKKVEPFEKHNIDKNCKLYVKINLFFKNLWYANKGKIYTIIGVSIGVISFLVSVGLLWNILR